MYICRKRWRMFGHTKMIFLWFAFESKRSEALKNEKNAYHSKTPFNHVVWRWVGRLSMLWYQKAMPVVLHVKIENNFFVQYHNLFQILSFILYFERLTNEFCHLEMSKQSPRSRFCNFSSFFQQVIQCHFAKIRLS